MDRQTDRDKQRLSEWTDRRTETNRDYQDGQTSGQKQTEIIWMDRMTDRDKQR